MANHLKTIYKIILSITLINLLVIVGWFLLLTRNQDTIIKNNTAQEINSEEFQEYVKDYTNVIEKDNNKYITFEKEDVDKVLNLIVFLKKDFEKAKQSTINETSVIIDKVNLFLSIGIVLLTLMGIFIPIIVQTFSQQEIKDNQEKLTEKQNELIDTIGKKDEKINSISTKIIKVSKNLEKEKIKLESTLSLANEIGSESEKIFPIRLVFLLEKTLDKNLMTQYTLNPKEYLKAIIITLKALKNEFENCSTKKIYPNNDDFYKSGLEKFISEFDVIILSLQDRTSIELYERLIDEIRVFSSLPEYSQESYKPLLEMLTEIITT